MADLNRRLLGHGRRERGGRKRCARRCDRGAAATVRRVRDGRRRGNGRPHQCMSAMCWEANGCCTARAGARRAPLVGVRLLCGRMARGPNRMPRLRRVTIRSATRLPLRRVSCGSSRRVRLVPVLHQDRRSFSRRERDPDRRRRRQRGAGSVGARRGLSADQAKSAASLTRTPIESHLAASVAMPASSYDPAGSLAIPSAE